MKIKKILINLIPSKRLRRKLRGETLELRFRKITFSQEGEDVVLDSVMHGKQEGFYVDVGALHPSRFSNTKIFYDRGWRGINIDATPGSMNLFKKFRTRDINLEIGVGEKEEELNYYLFDDPALNTFSSKRSNDIVESGNHKLVSIKKVKSYPLSKILDKYLPKGQNIDFMNIDVEGMDLVILKTNNWKKYSPKYLLVEFWHSTIDDIIKSEEYAFITSKGYKLVAKTILTMIFEKEK